MSEAAPSPRATARRCAWFRTQDLMEGSPDGTNLVALWLAGGTARTLWVTTWVPSARRRVGVPRLAAIR